ncbi:MAG: hypothetical protein JST05_04745 [Acidobacteria bacterium]|nr:hypothetical protein [Acidobacteriota bacterium]
MPFLPPQQQPVIVHLEERSRLEHGISDRQSFRETAQTWDGQRLFETGYGTLREVDHLQPPHDFGKAPADMAWYLTYDVVDGVAFAWGFGDDRASGQKGRALKDIRSTLYIYRNGGARWELWDTLKAPEDAGISWLRPLEGGGYLLGGRFPDDTMHRQDPLAIARSNRHGRLLIQRTEEVDSAVPAFIHGRPSDVLPPSALVPGVNDQPRWFPNPKAFAFINAFGTETIRVPGHLLFIDLHLGRFLVVDSRTGEVERQAHLFDLPEDAPLQAMDYEWAILGAQPRPDGHILLAARSAEAVQQSETWKPDLPPPEPVRLSASEAFGKSPEEQGEAMEMKQDAAEKARAREAQEARLRAFPDLVWWDFNPDTGTFRQEPSPIGVPDRFPSLAALQAFQFAFKPDGNLEIEPKVWK